MYKDSQEDYFTAEEVGIIFTTEANQTNHDLYHNKDKIEGIETIANYRNKSVETIGGREVPVNSWRKDIMVTDDEIIELIKSQEINGVSLNTGLEISSTCAKELKNIKGNTYYNRDIENKECMIPLFTSLVPDPANGYGMNVYSYDKFLEKCNPNGLIERIKSKSSGGGKLSNEFKEMLKGFGESIIGYADEIGKMEDSEEMEEVEETITENEVEKTIDNNLANDVAELKKSVEKQGETIEKQNEEIAELKKGDVIKVSDSLDDRRENIRQAIFDKEFSDTEDASKHDLWINLITEKVVVIEVYDENKYYSVPYTSDDEGNISIGDLTEVELQYAEVGDTGEEEEEDGETESESETSAPESQKSKQPQIKVPNEKLETIEMEKQTKTKTNHLGMPVRSTKELAKARNQFDF